MNTLIIGHDIFDTDKWERLETINIIEALQSRFDKFPSNARIYHKFISLVNDVTPNSEEDINNLLNLNGTFYVVLYPGDPITIVVAVIAVAATAAAAFLLAPKVPTSIAPSTGSAVADTSSNNQLSARSNKPRLNGRIPDIYGQVRAIPDLITLPYTFFDTGNIEYESAYMCVGRGEYDISDIKEGTSPFTQALGGYAFYSPNNSPIYGSPFLSLGVLGTHNAYNRALAIDNDILNAPGATSITYTNGVIFSNYFPGTHTITGKYYIIFTAFYQGGSNPNPASLFFIGDTLTLSCPSATSVNGNYTITAMGYSDNNQGYLRTSTGFPTYSWWIEVTQSLAINDPLYSSQYWLLSSTTGSRTASISKSDNSIFGPFTIGDASSTKVLINFIAPSGIFGGSAVTIEVKTTNVLTGVVTTTNCVLNTYTQSSQRGYTFEIDINGITTIQFRRTTAKLSVSTDEIRVRDLFYGNALDTSNQGDVTTVLVISRSSTNGASVSERKFNCLATRKLPTWLGGTSFSSTLTATQNAADIISAICLDSKIGRRSVNEIDFTGIYAVISDINSYFSTNGCNLCSQFNYTFDRADLSFEETIASIAGTIHCVAYRQGSVIKLKFEKENSMTTLLFNHRNILPKTMNRAIKFGIANDNDGITVKYIDPATDKETILYIPDNSITSPKEVDIVGVRNKVQAYYLGWRAWLKLKYSSLAVEFTATQESDLLTISDRILIADTYRTNSYDGEILDQTGLNLTLSIDVNVQNGDTIFLQYYDGTVGSRTIVAQPASNVVTINNAPSLPLVTDIDNYIRTTFIISPASSNVNLPFLIVDKQFGDKFTNILKAINYDANYYSKDHVNYTTI